MQLHLDVTPCSLLDVYHFPEVCSIVNLHEELTQQYKKFQKYILQNPKGRQQLTKYSRRNFSVL